MLSALILSVLTTITDKTAMVEYCVYWLENGEPMHEVFSSLAAAEMYSCAQTDRGA